MEVVRCAKCGKLLRRRPRLSEASRAHALAWRWAAAQLAKERSVAILQGRRKLRGDSDEAYGWAMLRAAEMLLSWARTVHKRPPLREADRSDEQ